MATLMLLFLISAGLPPIELCERIAIPSAALETVGTPMATEKAADMSPARRRCVLGRPPVDSCRKLAGGPLAAMWAVKTTPTVLGADRFPVEASWRPP